MAVLHVDPFRSRSHSKYQFKITTARTGIGTVEDQTCCKYVIFLSGCSLRQRWHEAIMRRVLCASAEFDCPTALLALRLYRGCLRPPGCHGNRMLPPVLAFSASRGKCCTTMSIGMTAGTMGFTCFDSPSPRYGIFRYCFFLPELRL